VLVIRVMHVLFDFVDFENLLVYLVDAFQDESVALGGALDCDIKRCQTISEVVDLREEKRNLAFKLFKLLSTRS